jgi:hypothetical protein
MQRSKVLFTGAGRPDNAYHFPFENLDVDIPQDLQVPEVFDKWLTFKSGLLIAVTFLLLF